MKQTSLRTFLLAAGYSALAVLVLLATVIFVAVARGYSYDFDKGEITQQALLEIVTLPKGALVNVDSGAKVDHSPFRVGIDSGEHTIKITEPGYRDWEKTVTLGNFEVQYHDYITLIPDSINTTLVREVPNISLFSQSPDQKSMVIVESTNPGELTLLSVGGGQNTIALTDDNAKKLEINSVKWSLDSVVMLVTTKTKQSYLVNVNSGKSSNVTDIVGSLKGEISFVGARHDLLYLDSGSEFRFVDVNSKTLSSVIAKDYFDISVMNQNLIAVLMKTEIRLIDSSGGLINTIPLSGVESDWQIHSNTFGGTYRLLVEKGATKQIELLAYNDPKYQIGDVIVEFNGVLHSQNTHQRFIIVENEDLFLTYDVELRQSNEFRLGGKISTPLSWASDYHLATVIDGQSYVLEYDGANMQKIGPSEKFQLYFSHDMKKIYTITTSDITNKKALLGNILSD